MSLLAAGCDRGDTLREETTYGVYQRCLAAMAARTCSVSANATGAAASAPVASATAPAGSSASPPAAAGTVFVAGAGRFGGGFYSRLERSGDGMCTLVQRACDGDWQGAECRLARAIYPSEPSRFQRSLR